MDLNRSLPNLRKAKKISVKFDATLIFSYIVVNDEDIEGYWGWGFQFEELGCEFDHELDEIVVGQFQGLEVSGLGEGYQLEEVVFEAVDQVRVASFYLG